MVDTIPGHVCSAAYVTLNAYDMTQKLASARILARYRANNTRNPAYCHGTQPSHILTELIDDFKIQFVRIDSELSYVWVL
jgi:hypothetical protein